MNLGKQTWVNINLVKLVCYIMNDKSTPHIKELNMTENMQEIIISGYYLLKDGNDGICSKISDNSHPFLGFLFPICLDTWYWER